MGFENGHLLRVVLRAGAGEFQRVNVLHYDLINVAGSPNNDPQVLADLFRDNVMVPFRALFGPGWTIDPVSIYDERDPQAPFAPRNAWTSGSPGAGTKSLVGEDLPDAMVSVATLKTDHIGRRYRGRLFLPGTNTEDDHVSSGWSTAQVARWNTYLNAIPRQPDIATGISESTAKWVVYSKTQRTQDLDPYASPVTSASAQSTVKWLRSREV